MTSNCQLLRVLVHVADDIANIHAWVLPHRSGPSRRTFLPFLQQVASVPILQEGGRCDGDFRTLPVGVAFNKRKEPHLEATNNSTSNGTTTAQRPGSRQAGRYGGMHIVGRANSSSQRRSLLSYLMGTQYSWAVRVLIDRAYSYSYGYSCPFVCCNGRHRMDSPVPRLPGRKWILGRVALLLVVTQTRRCAAWPWSMGPVERPRMPKWDPGWSDVVVRCTRVVLHRERERCGLTTANASTVCEDSLYIE